MLRFIAGAGFVVLVVCALVVIVFALKMQPAASKSEQGSWPTLQADPTPPLAVFIGGSYSAGVGASVSGERWTTLLAAAKGWREVNLALGGTGYLATAGLQSCGRAVCANYETSVQQAIANKAEVVVIAGGESDQSQDIVTEQAAIAKVYRTLRAGLPDARIVAVGPQSPGAIPGSKLIAIDAAVASAARSIGAVYVSLLDPPVLTQSMVLPTWPFIGDAGHAAIEKRIATALG